MTGPCGRCGAPVTRDGFRSRCQSCSLSPAFCRCVPTVVGGPEWLRRAREGRGLAKDMTGRVAA
jgi:hypothetical protein